MSIDILCVYNIKPSQIADLDLYAKTHGLSREEAVRRAVAFFCDKCVPTQKVLKTPSSK